MATKKKLLQAAAGNAGGEALNVEDVFSTYLYEGNGDGSAATNVQTINNEIDLSGEGGMVWIKGRSHTTDHIINDTVRGAGNTLQPHLTDANQTGYYDISQFNSDGFGLDAGGNVNNNGYDYASWTFRKAPKFFDVVTFTSTGSDVDISHNLGAVPAMIIGKRTDASGNWMVWHIGTGMSNGGFTGLSLNTTASSAFTGVQSDQGINSSTFNTGYVLSSDSIKAVVDGASYVFYLFAHNDGDGEFGPDADADIIKCGSYTGNGSNTGPVIDLGFEPQWLLVKKTSGAGSWVLIDTMRGFTNSAPIDDPYLRANASSAESFDYLATPLASGFQITRAGNIVNTNGGTYIYMAIRRGTKAPESATEVFAIDTGTGTIPTYVSGFPVDMSINRQPSVVVDNRTGTRLTGSNRLVTNSTNSQASDNAFVYDYMDGWSESYANSTHQSWMWKRAPGYFDVVAYSGSTSTQNISHNLGVQPEMIWIKNRDDSGTSWTVLFTSLGARKYLSLDTADGAVSLPLYNGTDFFANTLPTSSVFTVGGGTAGGGYDNVGSSGSNYIAYLFASLPGISKVGSYTGTGSTLNIDCGFSSGARFVLLKKSSGNGSWYVFDTERGIVTGNDPYLYLNLTNAEVNSRDGVDPLSSGFALTSDSTFNASGATYIFYAIA